MDYLFMVPFAGVTAFDRMARAAADMGERWHKFVSHLAQKFFPATPPPAWFPPVLHISSWASKNN